MEIDIVKHGQRPRNSWRLPISPTTSNKNKMTDLKVSTQERRGAKSDESENSARYSVSFEWSL